MLQLTPAQFHAIFDAFHEQRKIADYHLSWIRLLLASPYRDKQRHPTSFTMDEFVVFSDTAKDIQKQKEQTPDQMLAYVQNFLHPYFQRRAEIEKLIPPEELN